MKSTFGIALVLAVAASDVRADHSLDAAGGSVFVTSIDGTRAMVHVRTADGTHARVEVIPTSANAQPIRYISHTSGGLAIHAGAGGPAPLTTSLFRYGGAEASSAPHVLRDADSGAITKPAYVRTIALDPTDSGAVLLDARHVLLSRTGQPRALALVQRSSGEALLVDYDLAGGPVRRTPLGFTPPIGSNKGSFMGTADGRVWAALASANGVRLLDLGDLSQVATLQPVQKGVIAGGAGFDPHSTHLGIIAILIGLVAHPAPAVSYQRGDELFVSVLDGAAFRTVARQTVPPEASGLIEDEGLFQFIYLLPYIEQENLYRGALGQAAEPIQSLGH